ncbi:neuralized-like protein 2 [Clytia hemisphaerica]|uniref:NHR domain-containing protein n=1 Tax=Clytia hemisphaerica TaxID=252671 RepID=A0A7M5XF40_9CNID
MIRFHKEHGQNIRLSEDCTVASRTQSFANALVFSQRPLEESEVFMVEITEHERGWAGNLRCGITLHNPADIVIPQYLLPDLYQLGRSCVFSIKPCMLDPFSDMELSEKNEEDDFHCKYFDSITNCKTTHNVHPELLVNEDYIGVKPCDRGSRIGFFISPGRELFFIINGIQYGPCAGQIPINGPVYAALDLYGMTSQIKVINCHVARLKTLSMDSLSSNHSRKTISEQNLPKLLKKELLLMYGLVEDEEDKLSLSYSSSKRPRLMSKLCWDQG